MVNASGFKWPYEPEVLELLEHEAPYAAAAEYRALGEDRMRPWSSKSGDGDTDNARFFPWREKLCANGLHSPEPGLSVKRLISIRELIKIVYLRTTLFNVNYDFVSMCVCVFLKIKVFLLRAQVKTTNLLSNDSGNRTTIATLVKVLLV